ncbi:extensin family protein [Myxococcota bacterium]
MTRSSPLGFGGGVVRPWPCGRAAWLRVARRLALLVLAPQRLLSTGRPWLRCSLLLFALAGCAHYTHVDSGEPFTGRPEPLGGGGGVSGAQPRRVPNVVPAASGTLRAPQTPPWIAPEPATVYPFHAPLPSSGLPSDAPAVRLAQLWPAGCRAELKRRRLPFKRDRRPTPGVASAQRFTGPIQGVKFVTPGKNSPFGVLDCRLALALAELAPVLAEHGVAEVHIGSMYRRGSRLARTGRPSQHGHGLAADIAAFRLTDGRWLAVEENWQAQIGDPPCGPDTHVIQPSELEVKLRNMVCDIARRRLFHTILTPNYDAAHRDHWHLDIRRDARHSILR